MNRDDQDHKKFLEEQLEWCKKQDRILEEMDMKLHEMKELAEYVLINELTSAEKNQLGSQ